LTLVVVRFVCLWDAWWNKEENDFGRGNTIAFTVARLVASIDRSRQGEFASLQSEWIGESTHVDFGEEELFGSEKGNCSCDHCG